MGFRPLYHVCGKKINNFFGLFCSRQRVPLFFGSNTERTDKKKMFSFVFVFLLVLCVTGEARGQPLCGRKDTREVINFDGQVVPLPVGIAPLFQSYFLEFLHTRYEYIDLIHCNNPDNPDTQNMSASPPNVILTLADDDLNVRCPPTKTFTLLSFKLLSHLVANMSVFVNTTGANGQLRSSQIVVLPLRKMVTVTVNQANIRSLSVSCVNKGSTNTCWNTFYDDFDICYPPSTRK